MTRPVPGFRSNGV